MTNVLVYDDQEQMLQRLAEQHDITVAELLDIFLPSEDDMQDQLEEQGL